MPLRNSMEVLKSQGMPFSIPVGQENQITGSKAALDNNKEQLRDLFPASYCTELGDLVPPQLGDLAWLVSELDVRRLNRIHGWLWMAGRLLPPRPLHHQFVLGREVTLTEQMDLHLVRSTNQIFLKPIPPFLFKQEFWDEYLTCRKVRSSKDTGSSHSIECGGCVFHKGNGGGIQYRGATACEYEKLRSCALGFLFSYAGLVRHQSDLVIAKEKHLLPSMTWVDWKAIVEQLDMAQIYPKINPRFLYGELRLSRLNVLNLLLGYSSLNGYLSPWHEYTIFIRDLFMWLALATVFIVVLLDAMQVGLATEYLGNNSTFQAVSYRFTIFAIIGPLTATTFFFLFLSYAFIHNWVRAAVRKNLRLRHVYSVEGP